MYVLYTLVSIVVHLVLVPYFLLWPAARQKRLPSLKQRLGFKLPPPTPAGQPCIWVHAVSVGEVLAVRRLIEQLNQILPDCRIVLSTVTNTGNELACKQFSKLDVFYLPIDWPWIIKRFLRTLKPTLLVSAELEVWPNFYHCLKRRGTPIVIVNGRITSSSFRNYRYARRFFRSVLSGVRLFLMQSEADAERIEGIGADPEATYVLGNLKYDLVIEENQETRNVLETIRQAMRLGEGKSLLVAGSTVPGEEEAIVELLQHLRQKHENCKLILAPRHPARFDEVAAFLEQTHIPMARRRQLPLSTLPRAQTSVAAESSTASVDVLLLDSIGELPYVYQLATLAFVGGSLVPHGGHNILEPAYFARPILFGPHMENFRDISKLFLEGKGAVQASDLEDLKQIADRLLSNPEERRQLGARAQEIIGSSGGALERTLDLIVPLVKEQNRDQESGE